MRRPRILVAAAALALAGCSVLHNPHAGPVADAWVAARDRYTRTQKLYDRFETHAYGSAIWETAEVRARRVDQEASGKAMTAGERERLAAAQAAEAARYDDFLVAFFTTESRDNDLDSPRSIWRVARVAEGRPDELPAEIRIVRVDGLLKDLYPFIHDYDTVYRVRFARPAASAETPVTLRIAGSEGQMDFTFP